MNPPTLCLTRGLSTKEIETCAMAYYVISPEQARLNVIPITDVMLPHVVQDVLTEQGTRVADPAEAKQATPGSLRVVLIMAQEREAVMQIVKSFKSALPNPAEVIFAMITETALTWTFAYYFEHLTEEHEYMKTHRPEDDPDMKPM